MIDVKELAHDLKLLSLNVQTLVAEFKEHKVDFEQHKIEFKGHKIEFKERGKNHDRTAQTMNDFANAYNKSSDLISKLYDKVTYLEKKEAVHDMIIIDFKKFITDSMEKMSSIEQSIVSSNSKDKTRIEMIKFVAQLLTPIGTSIGVIYVLLKYLGKI